MSFRYIINLFGAFGLLLYGCDKKDPMPQDAPILIKYMESIGDFHYDKGKLVRMGNQEFFYDQAGRLAKSTELVKDTSIAGDHKWGMYTNVIHRYTVYAYSWSGQRVSKIQIDSLHEKRYLDGALMQEHMLGDLHFADLAYDNNRLSTLSYTMYLHYGNPDGKQICTIAHAYGEAGNLSQTTYTYRVEGVKPLPGYELPEIPLMQSTVTHQSYDQRINPISLIQAYLGVVPPSHFNANHSPNNVLVSWTPNPHPEAPDRRREHTHTYTYNEAGAPTLIETDNGPGYSLSRMKITYY